MAETSPPPVKGRGYLSTSRVRDNDMFAEESRMRRIDEKKPKPKRDYYDQSQFEQIQAAYKRLFPILTPELREYWNFEHAPRMGKVHRPHYTAAKKLWPYLTTNFHDSTYAQLLAVSDAASDIDRRTLTHRERGELLAAACDAARAGLSIGISPWTDHALFASRAWESKRDRLVLVLGHDWYPIATHNDEYVDGCHPCDVPLARYQALDDPNLRGGYRIAIPDAVRTPDRRTAVLFMNLVPDLRAPGYPKEGKLWGYADWVKGLDAVLDSVLQTFKPDDVAVLTWGAETWRAILPRLSAGHGFGIKGWQSHAPGQVLRYRAARGEVRVLPSAHPSYAVNLHKQHLQEGFANLSFER
jgi:hypothetical protein